MKKIYLVLIFVSGLMLFGCYSRDDYYDREIRLRITDAAEFDAENAYVIGDTLVFELKFSRYLEEDGYSNLLDIYETTDSESFGYNFRVEKFSDFSTNFERINIDETYVIGTKSNDDYNGYYGGSMAAVLDDDLQGYTSKVGVILVEEGRFRIDLDYISLNSTYQYGSENEKVRVSIDYIQTPENQLEAEFTVSQN